MVTATRLRRLADQSLEGDGDIGLGGRDAVAHGVGRIADEGRDAFLAKLPQSRLVGGRAGQRVVVELPVAGMEHGAERRCGSRRADGSGIEWRHADELDVEGADLAAAPIGMIAAESPRRSPFSRELRLAAWRR